MPAVPAPILRGTSSSKFARPWLSKCSQNEPSGCQAVVRVPFLLQMEGASADYLGRTCRLGSDRGSFNHWEHAVVEAGDAANPIAGEGEDEEAGPVAEAGRGVGRPRTPADRWLASGRGQTLGPSGNAGEQAGHDVAALVFEGNRWHAGRPGVG
jgi:hypothetical protein